MGHRQIWEQHYGPIPKDKHGRSLEIHHINGDHTDNRIENLKLVTIQEHYNIHWEQGDYVACHLIAQRMAKTPQELSRLISESNKRRTGKLNPFFGKHHTAKNKAIFARNARLTHTGKIQSEETKKKISASLMGVKKTKEHSQNIALAHKGKAYKGYTWKVEYKGKEIIVKNLKQFCRDKQIEPFTTFNWGKEIKGYKKVGRA